MENPCKTCSANKETCCGCPEYQTYISSTTFGKGEFKIEREIEKVELDEDNRLSLDEFKRTAEVREDYCFFVFGEYKELRSVLDATIKRLYMSGFDKYQIRGILISEIEDVLYDLEDWKNEEYYDRHNKELDRIEKKEDDVIKNILTEFLNKESIDRFISLLDSVRKEMRKNESPCFRCEDASPENCCDCTKEAEWKASRNKEE